MCSQIFIYKSIIINWQTDEHIEISSSDVKKVLHNSSPVLSDHKLRESRTLSEDPRPTNWEFTVTGQSQGKWGTVPSDTKTVEGELLASCIGPIGLDDTASGTPIDMNGSSAAQHRRFQLNMVSVVWAVDKLIATLMKVEWPLHVRLNRTKTILQVSNIRNWTVVSRNTRIKFLLL